MIISSTAEQGASHSVLAHSAPLTIYAFAKTMLTSSCKSAKYRVECQCIDRVDQITAGFTSPVALEGILSALHLLTVVEVLHCHSAFN